LNSEILFDTGIILRASVTTLDNSKLGLVLWEKAKTGEILACIAQQTVFEFFSFLTRLGISHRKAIKEIRKHLKLFPVIMPKPDTFSNTMKTVNELKWLKGAQIYDVFLAHTALDNGIGTIYTFNDKHFMNFRLSLNVVNPVHLPL
jgi:predicted nucleic acid-binding protein